MYKFLFIVLLGLFCSCKNTQQCYIEYSDVIIVYDTIVLPSNHIHHPDHPICLWNDADTIPICIELPFTIRIPKPKKDENKSRL